MTDKLKLAPGLCACYYALLCWLDYQPNQAYQLVLSTNFDVLCHQTSSLNTIIHGKKVVEEYILKGETLSDDYFKNQPLNEKYFSKFKKIVAKNFKNNAELFSAVLQCAVSLHDYWVMENTEKYNRNDKKAFQHLPAFLIGPEEIAKDLTFISPLLRLLGIDVGDLNYKTNRTFLPSKKFLSFYEQYVLNNAKKYEIFNRDQLYNRLPQIINEYFAIQEENAIFHKDKAISRLNYLLDDKIIKILTESIYQNNKFLFKNNG